MRSILAVMVLALFAGASVAQTERKLVETDKHIVTVSKDGDSVVFVLEAITDFTKDRDSSKPLGVGWDFAGIRVDINNNKVIDGNVDIAFGTRQKTDRFCPQYLIHENASSGCGVLRSGGAVTVEHVSSQFQSSPHPVHTYRIPYRELMKGGGKIGLTFRFSDASTGTYFFPSKKRPRTFDETIQLDLSEF